ncbi:MAG: type II toxin-antitoxin system RelE/ParE family toxin [bacterium]
MNENYKVIWAGIAENDLSSIIEYIANDSPTKALQTLQKIKEKTSSLFHSPERGLIVPELQEQGIFQYRELIVPPWRVNYRISGKDIHVLSALDSRQNVEDILFRRLINSKN